jgi:hypothetical protein
MDIEKQLAAMWKRIDENSKLTQEVKDLTQPVKTLAENQERQSKKKKKTADAVREIKEHGGRQWQKLMELCFTALAGAAIMYLMQAMNLVK